MTDQFDGYLKRLLLESEIKVTEELKQQLLEVVGDRALFVYNRAPWLTRREIRARFPNQYQNRGILRCAKGEIHHYHSPKPGERLDFPNLIRVEVILNKTTTDSAIKPEPSDNQPPYTPIPEDSVNPQEKYQGNHIFYGPPGTGKTYKMQALKKHYKEGKRYDFVTFHQSYGYEDFIEGLRPKLGNTGQVQYEIRTGVFKALCERAKNDPANRYAMFIDEINRGNISKILGELITLIELDKREGKKNELSVTLPYSGDIFSVPANVDIIGTMNTADRSLALLDTALRRRFEFTELAPDYELLNNKVIEGIHLRSMLETMNQRIEALYDREHCLGHAYFLHCPDFAALQNTFKTKILPLLQEYFFDDWEKIRLVLGDNQKQNQNLAFVNLESPTDEPTELERLFGNIADDHHPVLKKRYKINGDAFKNPEAYKGIYQRA